ncbi:MAG TPA: endonuclease/exonuclease/phosphatase family protein, partial [Thermomicrobiaceae bacterium]|nr:endonuclease/exonuclease/phosphatase family protein [Thermomicrobiaceae bacterium]
MTSTSLRAWPDQSIGFLDTERRFLMTLALAAVSTTLMLEAIRVFVAYMVFVIDQSNRTRIAEVTFIAFGAIALGGLLAWLLGRRSAVLVGLGILLISRLILQFWEAPAARLVLGALGLIGWGWLMLGLLASETTTRRAVALGVAGGFALDLTVRIAAGTVDLPWMPGASADVAAVVLCLLALLTVLGLRAGAAKLPAVEADESTASTVSLIGVGGGLALFLLLSGNLGLIEQRLHAGFPAGAALMALGAVLGLGMSWLAVGWVEWNDRRLSLTAICLNVALLVAGNWLSWQAGISRTLTALGFVLATSSGLALLAWSLLGGRKPGRVRLTGLTLWLTLGMLLQAVILFAYYTFSGRPSIIWFAIGLLALGALAGAIVDTFAARPSSPKVAAGGDRISMWLPAALLTALLALACLARWAAWSSPPSGAPLGSTITVMTYNIQTGFDRDEAWNLAQTADTIAAAHPDIVVLQEVSRGWLVTSSVDEALWLSRRLDMPVVFGPSSEDSLWGNAILTRAPVLSASNRDYTTTSNLRRGVLEVELATRAGKLAVFGTHLDDPVPAN